MSIGLINNVLNQKGTPAFYSDVFANRPTYGFAGRVFISTDTGQIYEDTGTSWTLIADATGSITGFVPYTGATQSVNLGTNNISANAFFNSLNIVTASGTQVVLTINSAPVQLITGSGGQTFKLPDATTLSNGTIFSFNNNQSSGAITVNNNSNTLVVSVPSGGYTTVVLLDNSTAAGSWDKHDQTPSNVSWSTNTLDYSGSITSATWNGNVIAINRGGTGSATQNFVDLTTNQSVAGKKTFNPSVTASTSLAQGTIFNPTLVAAANNDRLIGLDIAPTYTNGAFTGVGNIGLRIAGDMAFTGANTIYFNGFAFGSKIYSDGYDVLISPRQQTKSVYIGFDSGNAQNISFTPLTNTSWNFVFKGNSGSTTDVNLFTGVTALGKWFTTGNWFIGSSPTDAGYKLDVNGNARVNGNTYITGGNLLLNGATTSNGQGVLQNTGQSFTGGLGIGGLTFSTNTTATVNTSFYFFNGGAGISLTLPDTNGQSMIYYIKNYSASPLTIARTGSNTFIAAGTITTVTSLTLATGASTTIIGNGTTNYIQIQ